MDSGSSNLVSELVEMVDNGIGGGEAARFAELDHQLPEIRVSEKVLGQLEGNAWSSAFHARSHSVTPRSRQGSPRSPAKSSVFRDFSSSSSHGSGRTSLQSRFSNSRRAFSSSSSLVGWWKWKFWSGMRLLGFWSPWMDIDFQNAVKQRGLSKRKPRNWPRKRLKGVVAVIGVMVTFFLLNWWMLSRLQDVTDQKDGFMNQTSSFKGEWSKFAKGKRPQRVMYGRLLALAAHALAEREANLEPQDLWEEPLLAASAWTPCANQRHWEASEGNNGYILVSANGGISQQRVAVCNAVAVARLLNATLVVPKFLYSSVWRDNSQFSDIYQEEHFINYLKADIRIVKELPVELQSLDLVAIGSLVTDEEIMKESKPSFFLTNILPILLRNRVVHFVGFGNRLAFDPIPFQLQFVHKIQETGTLLVQRMRQYMPRWGPVDHNFVGQFAAKSNSMGKKDLPTEASRYLALHLRFEIDMAAYSLCEFGGEDEEREELEAYRSIHFPQLTLLKKSTKLLSAAALRSEGRCPLTPEEAVLMLAALGFKRKTRIFLAGAHVYGGKSRMVALTSLYPNLVTKEDLLSASEIGPFKNHSSQLAALDFIACAAADAFAMTDSGSQLSSLVSGYRIYYGGGRMPTIRPNKRRLAGIFSKNSTIEWNEFEERVRKTVKESKRVQERPIARSIYRHPRSRECMCKKNQAVHR